VCSCFHWLSDSVFDDVFGPLWAILVIVVTFVMVGVVVVLVMDE
jgi:uncharacterized membrane protein (DUF485 family)